MILGAPSLKSCRFIINFDRSVISFVHSPSIQIDFSDSPSPVSQQVVFLLTECKARLSATQENKLDHVLKSNAKALSATPGLAKNFEYHIMLRDKEPVRRHPYYLPKDKTDLLQDHIQELVQRKILSPIQSPYASPVFFVKICQKEEWFLSRWRFSIFK